MSDATSLLGLPYILPSQAQKHVTHNEALRKLDPLVQLAVIDRDHAVPPEAPAEGERYIVAESASDAWSGKDGCIAVWQDGAWTFFTPTTGWLCWVASEGKLFYRDAGGWADIGEVISELQNAVLLGVGTTADAVNPFAAKLNNALWTARYAGEGGDGNLRYTLNKEGSADVLSLLMQSNWSGRAEIGLIGSDDLTLKVSSDGNNWKGALTVDRTTGTVDFPSGSTAVARSGDTMAGPLQVPAGAASEPGIKVGDADTGLFSPGTGIALTVDGNELWRYASGREIRGHTDSVPVGGVQPAVQYHARDTGGSSFMLSRWSDDATGPGIYLGKSRGNSIGTPTAVQNGDTLGTITFCAADDASFRSGGACYIKAVACGDFSASDTRDVGFQFSTMKSGTRVDAFQMTAAGDLTSGSGDVIVDSSRILRLRSYTVSTLPSASVAAQLVYVSDGTSNKRIAVSDGSDWRFPDGNIVS